MRAAVAAALPRLLGVKTAVGVRCLKFSENYTFLLEFDGKKRVLRVNRPGYHTPPELETEINWLRQIAATTDVTVPEVYPFSDGGCIGEIDCGGEVYRCSLFGFLPGATLNADRAETAKRMRALGAVTAKLHLSAERLCAAGAPPCFTWGYDDLLGENARWGCWRGALAENADAQDVFGRADEIIRSRLEVYGTAPDRFGLIHSDLNIRNLMEHGGRLQVIDFDDCGTGWYMYDLSAALLEFSSGLGAMTADWLGGYREHRALSAEDAAILPTMLMMHKIARLGWLHSHAASDTAKSVSPAYLSETLALAREYTKNEKG
jgi:Ser/Thr protein kinase RdoA (MazF antagonist)